MPRRRSHLSSDAEEDIDEDVSKSTSSSSSKRKRGGPERRASTKRVNAEKGASEEGEHESGDEDNEECTGFSARVIAERAYRKIKPSSLGDIEKVPESLANTIVGDIVRLILNCNLTKKGCTGTKIKQEVFDKLSGYTWTKAERYTMIEHAMKRTRDVFGLHLVCTAHAPSTGKEDKKKPKPKKKSTEKVDDEENGSGKKRDGGNEEEDDSKPKKVKASAFNYTDADSWIVLDLNESKAEKVEMWKNREDNPKRGLLLVVLGSIMINEGIIREEVLQHNLNHFFSIEKAPENKRSVRKAGVFGHSGLVLKELEQENYIKRKRIEHDGGNVGAYTYGARSLLEIGLQNVLKFVVDTTEVEISQEEKKQFLTGRF